MLHLDIPTPAQFEILSQSRADACVSIYLPTSPLSQHADASRIELGNLLKEALQQLETASFDKRGRAAIQEHVEDLIDDYDFWRYQANSLAIFSTSEQVRTFRLPNTLRPQVEVSGRFHLKPLLRAITFPHVALVLALSENSVRLVEVFAEGPPVQVDVPELPKDAASASGKTSLNDRSLSGRLQGAEGKKLQLTKYARKVDSALRELLGSTDIPLFLASTDPLASIFRSVSGLASLAVDPISGNADRTTDQELAAAVRPLLDGMYARQLVDIRDVFESRKQERRATTDLSDAGRAAALGAVDVMLVDMDAAIPGTFDDVTGRITLADAPSKESYGVVDAIASRVLATGGRVLAVRQKDIADGAPVAAILRYAL